MFQRWIAMSGVLILLLTGCTLEASLDDQGGELGSAQMPRITKDGAEFSELALSEETTSEPSAEPTEIEATTEPTEEASAVSTDETVDTPQATATTGGASAAAGNRSQGSTGSQPTPTSPNDVPYATQCLEPPTGLVIYDLHIQAQPGIEHSNDLVGPALYPDDVVTLTGWWNDGTNPWWQIDYSGFRGAAVGWIPGFSVVFQQVPSPCEVYWPYIEPVIATPTPAPTPSSVALGTSFRVEPYQMVSLDTGNLLVRVVFINDMRCLPNTECVDPGSAVVDVEINVQGSITTRQLTLKDGVDPSTIVNGYRITLIALDTIRTDPNGPPSYYYITLVANGA